MLLSSHILAEVEALCDRVTIIRQGRAVQHGTLDELRSLTRTSIDVRTRVPLADFDTRAGVHRVRVDDDRRRFDVDGSAIDEVMRHAANAALAVLALLVVVGLFGPLLELPQWVRNLSPFEHVPALPGGSFDIVPLVVLTAFAVVGLTVGVRALARRDIG